MDKYGLKITYSWGDEEPIIRCITRGDAWQKAKEMAINEAEIASMEHECEIGLSFNSQEGNITLHYTYDDSYCYYNIIKV